MDTQIATLTPTKIASVAPFQPPKSAEVKAGESKGPEDKVSISTPKEEKPAEITAQSTFWSKAGKVALVAAGVAAGAAVAYGATQLAFQGTFLVNRQLFGYLIPKGCPDPQMAASTYIQAINRGLQVAPWAGGLAGGILTGLAMREDQESKRLQEHPGIKIKGRFKVALHNFTDTMRDSGDALKKGVKSVKEAKSFGEAFSAGGAAGYNVGDTLGRVGGFVEGAYEGAAMGAIAVGAPFAYPAISVPLAVIGGLAMGTVVGQIGSLVGGIGGAVIGATAGSVAYGAKKLAGAISG